MLEHSRYRVKRYRSSLRGQAETKGIEFSNCGWTHLAVSRKRWDELTRDAEQVNKESNFESAALRERKIKAVRSIQIFLKTVVFCSYREGGYEKITEDKDAYD